MEDWISEWRALNNCLPEGCQKLTSSIDGRLRRSWNQSWSVTPIKAFITNSKLLNCWWTTIPYRVS